MPFDGILTKHVTQELNDLLSGGRIRKIYQPENDEVRLLINKNKTNYTLLISANPNNNRIHLTNINKSNPDVPPTFCMTLRKQILNTEIESIEQLESDRVIIINLKSTNDFGEPCRKQLICEMTGRNSNIILAIEERDTVIIDSLKKVGFGKNRYRQILPGKPYLPPPQDDKINFNDIDEKELLHLLNNYSLNPVKFFTSHFIGISPAFVREICFRSKLDPDLNLSEYSEGEKKRLAAAFCYQIKHLNEKVPRLYKNDGDLLDYYGIKLSYLGAQTEEYDSFSELLEHYYSNRDKLARFKQKSSNLKQQLTTLLKKEVKKLQNLDKDYKASLNNEKFKLYGDLITANIYQLELGQKEAELLNYYEDPPVTVKVPLKVNETPSQNAQRFYKKYSKNKRAQKQLSKQIEKTQAEIKYLESLINSLETSTELDEFEEIKYEFLSSDLNPKTNSRKIKKPERSKPLHFVSSEGFDIYVGKNNLQNDYITVRLGKDEDCWLHVKDAPGSHVLIVADGKFIPEATVLEGGMLAAYYSKMSQSTNVPVDYMEHKYVKKPNHAKPGFVTFTNHNTMYVTPDKAVINNLIQK